MLENCPASMPAAHRRFLETALPQLTADERLVGVAAAGSYLTDSMDEFSDLDLVVAVEPRHSEAVSADRRVIAESCGRLLGAFAGDHVGEPRLLICLYDDPLLHVDYKFISLDDAADRTENPSVLWERDGRFTRAMQQAAPRVATPDPRWIEDRFWIWVHYAATKVGRGELFEALDFLAFLRARVLGPLAVHDAGGRPAGVRRLEQAVPDLAERLRDTVAVYDAADCLRAVRACVEIYRTIRPETPTEADERAARAALDYLARIESQHGL